MGTVVHGIWCYTCGDFIFSRAPHDYHGCSCPDTQDEPNGTGCTIDGGFNYIRSGWARQWRGQNLTVTVPQTEQELYNDWAQSKDKYGKIKQGKRPDIPAGVRVNRVTESDRAIKGSKTKAGARRRS